MNKVIITTEFFGYGLDREKEYAEAFRKNGMESVFRTLPEVWDTLDQFDGAIIGVEKADKLFFDQAKNLKVAMKFGVGLDNFDIAYAQKKQVNVENLPGVNSQSVAEMVLGLMLDVSRCITETNGYYKSGNFRKMLGSNMFNKTLGIIGTGDIGRTVMKMTCGLSMNILGYDPYPNEAAKELGCKYVELEILLKESDFISIHIPLSESTRHFISKKEFSLMKEDAILINTARGGIVDEAALAEAVKTGSIKGAGLDVFETHEPNQLFKSLSSIICTPHISALTAETLRKMEGLAIEKMGGLLGNKCKKV